MTNTMLIFEKDSDYNEWAKQREYVAAMDDIDEDLRTKLITAYEVLEQELGKGFLKSSHHNHPIRQMIANRTVWQIEELIKFTDTIQTLKKSDSGYPELRKLLLPNVKAQEQGVPFVKIAHAYIKENFKVNFPNDINNDKSPDIEIRDQQTNDHFFIEVSTINESEERAIRNENYQFLHNQFYNLRPHLHCICKQKDVIEKYDYPKVESIISQAKGKVLQSGQTIYFSDKYLEFLITTNEHVEVLEQFCIQNNFRQFDVEGLELNFDETSRLIGHKIKKEAIQILPEFNGLLYFPCSPLFFFSADIKNSITELEKYIAKFKNIIGIVFLSQYAYGFGEQETQKMGKHMFSRKVNKALCSESLFIYNEACELLVSEKTIEKIYKTLL